MSIRLREVDGMTVALCGYETDAMPGDVYLDDGQHYALAAKFASDWQGRTIDWEYAIEWELMESQKLRDARTRPDLAALPDAHQNGVSEQDRDAGRYFPW